MGWVSSKTRRGVEMGRLWNRLVNMEEGRVTKKVFLWDKGLCKRNWSNEVKQMLIENDMEDAFVANSHINLKTLNDSMHQHDCTEWSTDVVKFDKLRTYITFKTELCKEEYVNIVTNRQHRSALAQFRSGVLPLKIETGRFQNIPLEYRLCVLCNQDVIESESHFLLYCSKYSELRQSFYTSLNLCNMHPDFNHCTDGQKLTTLMSSEYVKATAKFIWQCYDLRRKTLYVTR